MSKKKKIKAVCIDEPHVASFEEKKQGKIVEQLENLEDFLMEATQCVHILRSLLEEVQA